MVKNLPANARDARDEGLIPGSGRSLGVGRGNPLQYSCLGDPMDRGTWWATVHWITNSPLDRKLSDTVHLGHLHARVRAHTHTQTHTHTHSEITNHLPPFSCLSLRSHGGEAVMWGFPQPQRVPAQVQGQDHTHLVNGYCIKL